jgi:toxin ParE1/3/4
MMLEVLLAEDAEHDIEDIWRYIARADTVGIADRIVDALEQACAGLSEMPDRGNVPKELAAIGIGDYREVHYKPYRIIYRVFGDRVVVYCIADGRRDMQSLLERRLLR